MAAVGLKQYDKWAEDFATDTKKYAAGTSFVGPIMNSIKAIYDTKKTVYLVILTDGGITDPCKEAHVVREAALHPLCISLIGISTRNENPRLNLDFDRLYVLDDNLFDRVFDNLIFTRF